MKIAVIGGGTAGYIAAAHLTKHFPACDLYHIYDSRIPTIGVGEGTTPNFPGWLHDITGLNYAQLQTQCNVTYKHGTMFEGWGSKYKRYMHYFQPTGSYAYHLSAAKLITVLQNYVSATYLDKKVTEIKSDGLAAVVSFEDETQLEFDLVFDAQGFPEKLDKTYLSTTWIPTNAALIQHGPVVDSQSATRSIARPHGWIFVLPLTVSTSYGYIYNQTFASPEEIEADFEQFLFEEQAVVTAKNRWLHFPNFTCRTFFDGALFKIGNAASFFEPLEATAIGMTLFQMWMATRWLRKQLNEPDKKQNEKALRSLNNFMLNHILKTSLFIGWHYANGSYFETQFWDFAMSNFAKTFTKFDNRLLKEEFEQYVRVGVKFPIAELNRTKTREEWNQLIFPKLQLIKPFGNFSELNFAQVGHGIGLS